jgi:putative endonuclease
LKGRTFEVRQNGRQKLRHCETNSVIPSGEDRLRERILVVEGPVVKEHNDSVYLMASGHGSCRHTSHDLHRRVWEYRNDRIDGFSQAHWCHGLLYYESFDDVNKAIDRQKQLKRWNRRSG